MIRVRMNPSTQFVECNGERYLVRDNNSLILECDVKSLNEVIGLKSKVSLEKLLIGAICLKDLNGLDKLVNLKKLVAPVNQIIDISGLANLRNLRYFDLNR